MKKLTFLALAGATALAGITLLGCSDKDELVDVNPTYDPETGTVTTQFAFNVSTSNTGSETRMSATNTQAAVANKTQFLGITDAVLMTYTLGADGRHVGYKSFGDDFKATSRYNLATILPAKQISGKDDKESHRVIELALPVGVNNTLFYGRAVKSASNDVNIKQGNILYEVSDYPSQTSFSLVPRINAQEVVPKLDDDGNYQYNLDGSLMTTTQESAQYKMMGGIETLFTTILNRVINNGLYKQTQTGTAGVRDFSYYLWWPSNMEHYELVDKTLYNKTVKSTRNPRFTMNGTEYILTGAVVDASGNIIPYSDYELQEYPVSEGGDGKEYMLPQGFRTREYYLEAAKVDGYDPKNYELSERFLTPALTQFAQGVTSGPGAPYYSNADHSKADSCSQAKYVKVLESGSYKLYNANEAGSWENLPLCIHRLHGTQVTYKLQTTYDSYTYYHGELDWREIGRKYEYPNEATTGHAKWAKEYKLSPLGEILGKAYTAFTTIKQNTNLWKPSDSDPAVYERVSFAGEEIRAGSASAISRMIADLWTVTNQVRDAVPTSAAEAEAQLMAIRISERFKTYFDYKTNASGSTWETPGNGTIITDVKFKSPADLQTQLLSFVPLTDEEKASIAYLVNDHDFNVDDLNKFPANDQLRVPFGAAQLKVETTTSAYVSGDNMEVFNYNREHLPAYGLSTDPTAETSIYKYVYPAELIYFGNSPLRVSEETLEEKQYPDGVKVWDNDASWTTYEFIKNSHVQANTRSVAVQENIQYGTALVKTTVAYSSDILEDNNKGVNGEEETNREYSTDDGTLFKVTGFVFAGQPKNLGWNCIAKPVATAAELSEQYTYMIYDNDVNNGDGVFIPAKAEGAFTTPNYTLVWDNYTMKDVDTAGAAEDQNDVYVSVELVNNTGKDFWGLHNVVRNGGTFYLIGKLSPKDNGAGGTANTAAIVWPATSYDGSSYNNIGVMAPYTQNGDNDVTTTKVPRVFMQDHVTIVNFKIGKESLKHAYVTVPDLRSANLSLGLSVDLKWEQGITFDVVLGE